MFNIVSDWNGTLTRSTEEESNKALGYGLLNRALLPWNWGRLPGLLAVKRDTHEALDRYHAGEAPLSEVYGAFNKALEGVPVSVVYTLMDRYAKATCNQLDHEVLSPILKAKAWGARTGILSVAYDRSIRSTLDGTPYRDVFQPEDIVANPLESRDGRAVGITCAIFGKKPVVFERAFLDERGFDPKKTFYFGDEDQDEGILYLLPHEHFIVPFLATDEYREYMAGKGAFVPEDRKDLSRFLFML